MHIDIYTRQGVYRQHREYVDCNEPLLFSSAVTDPNIYLNNSLIVWL